MVAGLTNRAPFAEAVSHEAGHCSSVARKTSIIAQYFGEERKKSIKHVSTGKIQEIQYFFIKSNQTKTNIGKVTKTTHLRSRSARPCGSEDRHIGMFQGLDY